MLIIQVPDIFNEIVFESILLEHNHLKIHVSFRPFLPGASVLNEYYDINYSLICRLNIREIG